MRVDCHMHVNYNGYDAKKIIAYLDANKFDCCWLLTWEELKPAYPFYQHLPISDVIDTYTKYPSKIIPMYAPDPQSPEAPDLLRYWYHKGVRGCAELKSVANWQSPNTRNLLSVAQELDLPVLFHMEESQRIPHFLPTDSVLSQIAIKCTRTDRLFGLPNKLSNFVCDTIPALLKWREKRIINFPGYMLDFISLANALEDFPGLTFIGHGPLFWKGVDSNSFNDNTKFPKGAVDGKGMTCQLLEKYENLYADLSAKGGLNFLKRDPLFTNKFISMFSNKLLYGSDTTGVEIYNYLDYLDLSSNDKLNIYGLNAYNILSKQNR